MHYRLLLCIVMVFAMQACKQNDELFQSLEGTYTFQRFSVNNKDSVVVIKNIPLPITQSEFVFSPNGYKGIFNARLQAAPDSAAIAVDGEYYIAQRSFQRQGIDNVVTPKSIIFAINKVIYLRTAFPLTDTIKIDSIRLANGKLKTDNYIIFNGEWNISKLASSKGETLELNRKGLSADSVRTYTLELIKQ